MLRIVQNNLMFPCRMDISSPNFHLEEISLSSRHQQDEFVSNDGHTTASNFEGHTIASSSNFDEVCEVMDDGRACWRTTGGLITAKKNTKWYEALLVSDCKSLMEQLHENNSLVVQTGHNGCTVLLVAARRGCTPLVNQVMHLFKDFTGQFITNKDRAKILLSPLHDLFQAEDFRTKLRAVEIMHHFMGSDVIQCHMNNFYGNKFSQSFRLSVGVLTGWDVGRITTTQEGNEDSRYSSSSLSYPAHDPPVSNKMNPLEGGGQNESGIPRGSSKAHGEAHMRTNIASKNNKHLEQSNNDFKSIPSKEFPLVSATPASGNDEHIDVDVLAKIRHITDNLLKNKKFEALMEDYSKHKDYNFDETRKEFIFHYACQSMSCRSIVSGTGHKQLKFQILNGSAYDFLWSFMKELEGEQKILQALGRIKNWQGKTPCHVALSGSAFGFELLLGLLRDTNNPMTIKSFLNACDARGWTPLHKAVAMVSEHDCWRRRMFINLLLKNKEVNVNEELPESHATPLHLAILHNLPQVVGSLIQSSQNIEGVINASLARIIRFSSTTQSNRRSSKWWSPLQLATIMGHPGVVEALVTKVCMMNSLILLLITPSMGS